MAGLSLLSLEPRSARRLRLLFSKTLAAAAFTSTVYYTVTNTDGSGTSPAVSAALAIPDTPYAVELALAQDLAPGGIYTVEADAVPALDASTTPTPTTLVLSQPSAPGSPSAELSSDDTLALIFGTDLIFQDGDFLEGPDGDLARQSGPENARAALSRAMVSEGLPHDDTYGAHVREYVDAPFAAAGTLPGKVQRVLSQDDRVKRIRSVEIEDFDSNNPTMAIVNADVELIGGVNVTVSAPVKVA